MIKVIQPGLFTTIQDGEDMGIEILEYQPLVLWIKKVHGLQIKLSIIKK